MTSNPQSGSTPSDAPEELPHFVVGGRYTDTSFSQLLEAAPALGPFDRHEDAVDAWRGESMRHIDEAFVRYLIVRAESAEAAATQAEESPSERPARSA
jgi:hypothetical protein